MKKCKYRTLVPAIKTFKQESNWARKKKMVKSF